MSGPHILHIEDNSDIQKAMRRLLEKVFSATVTTVDSGAAAMAVMGSADWAAVLSDWNIIGGMTGGDVYNLVRADYPHLASKYVFMSDDQLAAAMAAKYGLGWVEKPATRSDICNALNKAMV